MTKTELANFALSQLGHGRIMDIDEASPVAEAIRSVWDLTRDATLRRREWNFASIRKVLVRLSTAPLFDWTFAYQLPSDYIRAVTLNGEAAGTSQATWDIEGDVLLSNSEKAELVYIRRVEQVSAWDDGFQKAFATALSAAAAPSITQSMGLADRMEGKAEQAIVKAGGANLAEDRPRCILAHQDSEWMKARHGKGNW
jgi:hypothetical protein